jgi:hypothetical protein
MLDRFSTQLIFAVLKPRLRFVITEALLLTCAGAGAANSQVCRPLPMRRHLGAVIARRLAAKHGQLRRDRKSRWSAARAA